MIVEKISPCAYNVITLTRDINLLSKRLVRDFTNRYTNTADLSIELYTLKHGLRLIFNREIPENLLMESVLRLAPHSFSFIDNVVVRKGE
jgi:hypothetical protein